MTKRSSVFGLLVYLLPFAGTGFALQPGDWPMYMHDAQHTGYNPALPSTLAPPVVLRWSTPVASGGSSNYPGMRLGNSLTTPVVANGRVIIPRAPGGEDLLSFLSPTGFIHAIYLHPPLLTWSRGQLAQGAALVTEDRVIWGLSGGDGGDEFGLSAVPIDFNSDSTTLFSAVPSPAANPVNLASPVAADGLIFSADFGGQIFAIDKAGNRRWRYQTGGIGAPSPTVSSALGLVFDSASDGVVVALDEFQGTLSWTFLANGPLQQAASTDNTNVYVVSPNEGVLYGLDAKTGALKWVVPASPDVSFATPAIAGGKILWSNGDAVMALNPQTGAPAWVTPTPGSGFFTGGGTTPSVGNGYVWEFVNSFPTAQLYVLTLSDGSVLQNKTVPLSSRGAPALVADEGGAVIISPDARGSVAAYANAALPPPPPGPPTVEAHEYSLKVRWDEPLPPPVDPPPTTYFLVSRQGAVGAAFSLPDPSLAPQYAILNMTTGEIVVQDPGVVPPPPTAPNVNVRLPDNVTSPPSQQVFVVPAQTQDLLYEDAQVSPEVSYAYQILSVDAAGTIGIATPPSAPPVAINFRGPGAAAAVAPGADWVCQGFDANHAGWNAQERLSWYPFASGGGDAELPAFEFFGPPGLSGITFTEPSVAQGRAFVGGSDGRLYILNAKTGDVIWWLATGGPIRFPPAISESDNSTSLATGNVAQVNPFVGVSVASDDGYLYQFTMDPTSKIPRWASRHKLPGRPVCAPSADGSVLSNHGGSLWESNGTFDSQIGFGENPHAFYGPTLTERTIVTSNDGTQARIFINGLGTFTVPAAGLLTPHLIRPSLADFGAGGREHLLVGTPLGWYGLVEQPEFSNNFSWVPLTINAGGSSPVGGLAVPVATIPLGSAAPTQSLSLLTAAEFDSNAFALTGTSSTPNPCSTPGAGGGARWLNPPLNPSTPPTSIPITGVITSNKVAVVKGDGSVVFTVTVAGSSTTGVQTSQYAPGTPSGNFDLNYLTEQILSQPVSIPGESSNLVEVGCLGPTPLGEPTQVVIGQCDDAGNLFPTLEHHQGTVISRGMFYQGGASVRAEGWSAPLFPRALGKPFFDASGTFQQARGVTLEWSPPPGFQATGYQIYRRGSGDPGYTLIASVPGGDTRTYTDTSYIDAVNLESTLYYIRPVNQNGMRGLATPCAPFDFVNGVEPCVGAASLIVHPTIEQADAMTIDVAPISIFFDQTTLYQIRLFRNGLPAAGIVVSITGTGAASLGQVIWKLSPGDPGSTAAIFSAVSNQDGIVQLLAVPNPAAGLNAIWFSFTAGLLRPYLISSTPAFAITEDAPMVWAYTPGRDPNTPSPYETISPLDTPTVAAYIQQQFGAVGAAGILLASPTYSAATQTGPAAGTSTFAGVTLSSYPVDLTDWAISAGGSATDAVSKAVFYGSAALCQGIACSVPIDTYSGAMHLPTVDLVLPSRGLPLLWVRTYTNFMPQPTVQGAGWRNAYDMSMETADNGDLIFHRWDGSRWRYSKQTDGSFQSPAGFADRMVRRGDGTVVLTTSKGLVAIFDTAGRLVSESDRNGNTQTLSYAGTQLIRIADDVGQFFSITYDHHGRVAGVTDSTGRAVSYVYDNDGNLISATRPGHEQTAYQYAPGHLLTLLHDPRQPTGCKHAGFQYDSFGRVTQVVDGNGQVKHSFMYERHDDGTSRTLITETCCGPRVDEYDARAILTGQVDAEGHRSSFEFDDHLRLVTTTDRNGHITQVSYDALGRPTAFTDPLLNVTRFEYTNPLGFLSKTTDALGRVTRYTADVDGNFVQVIDAEGGTWGQVFNGFGNLVARVDALGHGRTFAWNAVGDLSTATDALGRTTEITFDIRHRLLSVDDPRGLSTARGYNDRDLEVSLTTPDGATARTEYDSLNRVSRTTDQLGNATNREYDGDDRLVRLTDPLGARTVYEYDVQGNLLSATDPNGHRTTYTYNHLNRRMTMSDPLGNTTRWAYDPVGNVVTVTDPGAFATSNGYDPLNRLIQVTNAKGALTKIAFNAAGNRVAETDANGHTTQFGYDLLGRRVSMTDPLNRTRRWTYDSAGNLATMTNARNQMTTYRYDAANQLLERRNSDTVDTYTYDPDGNLLVSDNAAERIEYTYNTRNLISVTNYPREKIRIIGAYDPVGRMSRQMFPGGAVTTYRRDAKGQVVGISDSQAGTVTFAFDAGGRLTREEWPNGIAENFQYDNASHVISILPDVVNDKSVPAITYTYDSRGNRLSMARSDIGLARFSYDELSQLSTSDLPGENHQVYVFDLVGNRLSLSDKRGIQKYRYDPADQLVDITSDFNPEEQATPPVLFAGPGASSPSATLFHTAYSFDDDGNEVKVVGMGNRTTSFTFSILDQLRVIASSGAGISKNFFDADGRRSIIANDAGKPLVRFLMIGRERLSAIELGASERFSIRYLLTPGGKILARIGSTGNNSVFYHFDAIGSTIAATDKDGVVTVRLSYDPYGAVVATPHTTDPVKYVGREGVREETPGLSLMGARFYEPPLGRFTCVDPLRWMASGPEEDSPSVNRTYDYRYADNNPVRFSDPSGLGVVDMACNLVTCSYDMPLSCETRYGAPCRAACNRDNDVENQDAIKRCYKKCGKALIDCNKSWLKCITTSEVN